MNKPKVLIPLESWRTIMAYTDLCETEVTGFFDAEYDSALHAFVVGKVYLVEQEAGGADVEMNEESIADFTYQLIHKGFDQLPRGWWHSHVNMGVFFSGTDDQTINSDFQNDSFTLSIVVNKKRQYKASCVIWEQPEENLLSRVMEMKSPLRLDDLDVTVQLEHAEIPKALATEVKKKVKARPIQIYTPPASQNSLDFSSWRAGSKKTRVFKPGKNIVKTKIDGRTPKSLPKDSLEALERIDSLDLVRTWKSAIKSFAYVDPVNDDIWLDVWGCVEVDHYKALRAGVDDTDRTELDTKTGWQDDPERCVNCHYLREFHNENLCQNELYPDDLSNESSTNVAGGLEDDDY